MQFILKVSFRITRNTDGDRKHREDRPALYPSSAISQRGVTRRTNPAYANLPPAATLSAFLQSSPPC